MKRAHSEDEGNAESIEGTHAQSALPQHEDGAAHSDAAGDDARHAHDAQDALEPRDTAAERQEGDVGEEEENAERPRKRRRKEKSSDADKSRDDAALSTASKDEDDSAARAQESAELSEQQRLDKEFEREVLVKAMRPKKTRRVASSKKGGDETGVEDISGATNEERALMAAITARAMQAADRDVDAVERQQPATHKLAMLGDLVALLQRRFVQEGDQDPALIEVLKRWLEPVRDSLPNAQIRTSILQALDRMNIDKDLLMMSGIGRPVLMLSRHPRETVDNRRIAQRLVHKWSAPIFASKEDDTKPSDAPAPRPSPASTAAARPRGTTPGATPTRTLSGVLAGSRAGEAGATQASAQRSTGLGVLPQRARLTFAQAPPSNWTDDKDRKKKTDADRSSVTALIREAKKAKQASKRAHEMGVNRLPNKF